MSQNSMLREVSYSEKHELFPGAKGLANAGRFLEACVQHLMRRIFEAYLDDVAAERILASASSSGHLALFCPPQAAFVRGEYEDKDVVIFKFPMDYGLSKESALASNIYDAAAGAQSACLMLEVAAIDSATLGKSWLLAVGATRSSAAAWARKIQRPASKAGTFELGPPVPVGLRSLWDHSPVRSFLQAFGCPSEIEECPIEMYAAALAETVPQPALNDTNAMDKAGKERELQLNELYRLRKETDHLAWADSEAERQKMKSIVASLNAQLEKQPQTFRTRHADWMESQSRKQENSLTYVSTVNNQMMGTALDLRYFKAWEAKGTAAAVR